MKPGTLIIRLAAFTLANVVSATLAAAATIDVTQAFRFIRTDSYAESGGLIDHGVTTIAGPSSPLGGLDAQGTFVSTMENTATVLSSAGSADSVSRVSVNSFYQLGLSELDFNVAATLLTTTATEGDGRIQNPSPDPNCCRSFSFLNHFITFELSEAMSYSITGVFDSNVFVDLLDLDSFTTVVHGLGSGTLDAGRYRFTVRDTIEFSGSTDGNLSHSLDVDFHLQAVPEPYSLLLFGTGAAAVAGKVKRWNKQRPVR